jgi:HEAT repeat protein
MGLIIVLGGAWALMPKEPTYEGKTVKEWFWAISNTATTPRSLSFASDDPAMLKIKDIGSNAVPLLIREFQATPPPIERATELANRWLHLSLHLDFDRTFRSYICLKELGPKGVSAVPELIKIAEDEERQDAYLAVNLLGRIHGQPDITVPALTKCLKSRNSKTIIVAVDALGEFGSQAKSSIPGLVALLRTSTNSSLTSVIKYSLREIDPEAAGIK